MQTFLQKISMWSVANELSGQRTNAEISVNVTDEAFDEIFAKTSLIA